MMLILDVGNVPSPAFRMEFTSISPALSSERANEIGMSVSVDVCDSQGSNLLAQIGNLSGSKVQVDRWQQTCHSRCSSGSQLVRWCPRKPDPAFHPRPGLPNMAFKNL